MKTFTLEEAQLLIPVLESLLKRAIEGKHSAEEADSSLSEMVRAIHFSGGRQVDLSKTTQLRLELDNHLARARESLAEIDAIGAQIKDLETGLLDFPCRLDDQIVMLCWKMGEPLIQHWHGPECGTGHRQPVDDRFRRHSNPGIRPN